MSDTNLSMDFECLNVMFQVGLILMKKDDETIHLFINSLERNSTVMSGAKSE